MLLVVAPLLHKLPVVTEEVSVTKLPSQKVVAPLTDIVGVFGNRLTFTVVAAELADVQDPTTWLTE